MKAGLLDDMLASMAGSLIQTLKLPSQDMMPTSAPHPRRLIKPKVGGYDPPPREIFYRQTLTYIAQPSPPSSTRRCSARIACDGSPASLQCFSCIIFDPLELGYYCPPCFRRKHPSYRVEHIFTGRSCTTCPQRSHHLPSYLRHFRE